MLTSAAPNNYGDDLTGIYLDYSAASPLRPEVAAVMIRVLEGGQGNPSSIHRQGHRARVIVEEARESVAALLGALAEEVVFTSGGTEANNLALFGAARIGSRGHLVVTDLEHSSVLQPARQLAAEGHALSRIKPDSEAKIDPEAVLREVRSDTRIVSVMHSSNEVGTLQPVAEIARGLPARRPLLHTDAVQSAGKVPLETASLGADLLSLSAHKIGGPAGVGCLWVRSGVVLDPLLRGGSQEGNRRAGTEAVSLIAGFGVAARLALAELPGESERIRLLRDRLEEEMERRIPGARFHGRLARRLPGIVSVALEGCPGEEVVMALDLEGISVSTGSACAAGTVRPSHVLAALGCSEEESRSTLRISLGRETAPGDLVRFVETLSRIVHRVRDAREDRNPAVRSGQGGIQ